MGCHTWFHKKINVSYEEARDSLVKKYKSNIELTQKWIDNPNDDEYVDMLKYYEYYTIEYLTEQNEIDRRKLRMVESGYCKEAVMRKYDNNTIDKFNVYHYIKNVGMFVDCEYHNLFRIPGYPEDMLFSLEETIEFIKINKNFIYWYANDWEKRLNEFWEKYPDGMITFG